MNIKVTYDKNAMLRAIGLVDSRSHLVATCQALDACAAQAVIEGRDEMRAVFDKPNAYTLRAMTMQRTKNLKPVAFFGINDKARYLDPQVTGGKRGRKRSEALLNPMLAPKRFYVPIGKDSINRGELQKVMSYLKVSYDAAQHSTEGSMKRKKNPSKYFVTKKSGKVAILERKGKGARVVYAGATQPEYKKRLDIQGVVDAVMFVHFEPKYEAAYISYVEKHSAK